MKKFINRMVDIQKLIIRIWFVLVCILLMLLIMKFCFGIWYPIVVNNEAFIAICNFIDSKIGLKIGIALVIYIINFNICYLMFTGHKYYHNWYEPLLLNILCVCVFFTKNYSNLFGFLLEILLFVIIASVKNIINRRYLKMAINIFLPIVIYFVLNVFQLSILLVRDLDVNGMTNYPVLIPYILQLDYYTFLIISWIGVSCMGIYGLGWFWTNDVTVLKAEREKELAKKNPDKEKIAEIEKKISELEAK